MPVAIRVIPCLDVDRGRVVKGVRFENLQDAGDPVELAALYGEQGADEITFLDVTATVDDRSTTYDLVRHTAENVFIPLTVGGGVRSVADVGRLLASGADKISVNSAALATPSLIDEITAHFGSQVCVVSVDAKRDSSQPSGFVVTTHGGRKSAGIDALSWAVEACRRGAGEVLLNSIDADGTKAGFDVEMIRAVRAIIDVPLVASGGAGRASDAPAAVEAGADAVLAASIFHHDKVKVSEVKEALAAAGAVVR
ncbi:MAG: imidazole glycerol phosphate synthase subunit HisH [Microbacteriaceae bacterium BACL25 MAG-120322-bin65]|jgi:imidazole glycerol-phosphate synthase subunit HisF|nr:MAG: imidazole glycerol phosphate synthase subunit HisH [Microbacteriaceae bacterium BACL25 MAG-120322-bin65]HAA78812.1 imidazole glycerol phosphate synthase subunit HisF [Microbacteriaceae bacterium]